MTKHYWHELTTWQGAAQVAASLHERDGYSPRSAMPTPQLDACLAPTPLCADSGWAQHMGGAWCCTAPNNLVPIDYGFVATCPARVPNKRTALSAQMPESLGRHHEPIDYETASVFRFVRAVLTSCAVGHPIPAVREYAEGLLCERDSSTTMDVVEALGRYLVIYNTSRVAVERQKRERDEERRHEAEMDAACECDRREHEAREDTYDREDESEVPNDEFIG